MYYALPKNSKVLSFINHISITHVPRHNLCLLMMIMFLFILLFLNVLDIFIIVDGPILNLWCLLRD